MIDKLFESVMRFIETLLAVLLVLAVLLNFANVVGRYGFNRSILGADEVQIYMMIWMSFLGAAVVTWRHQHLRMDMLLNALPAVLQTVVRIFEAIVLVVLSGLVVWQSGSYAQKMFMLGEKSTAAEVPMWIPHSAVVAGFILVLLIALLRAVQLFRRGGSAAPAGEGAAP